MRHGLLGHEGELRWHPLHLEGLDGLLDFEGPAGTLHLVHGFERMPRARASELAARLNLNRDRLEVLRGPVIVWIPQDFYEELLSQAPDFVAWRSQASVVPDADLGVAPELLAEEALSCRAQIEGEQGCADLPLLDIVEDGVRRPLFEWASTKGRRCFSYRGEDDPLRVVTWLGWQLARARDRGEYAWVPALLPSTLTMLAEGEPGVAEGVRRLWASGALDLLMALPLAASEWRALGQEAGDKRLLAPVVRRDDEPDPPDMVELATLSPAQAREMIYRSTAALEAGEREAWRELLAGAVEELEDRVERAGALAAVIAHWRHLGLSAVRRGLSSRRWRARSLRSALAYHGVPLASGGSPGRRDAVERLVEALRQPSRATLAAALSETGSRLGSASMLERSLTLVRGDEELRRTAEHVHTLVWLAQASERAEEEIPLWREALELSRHVEVGEGVALDVLKGLAFALYLAEELDEAALFTDEGLRRARALDPEHPRVVEFSILRAHIARAEERFDEALAILRATIEGLERSEAPDRRQQLIECWELCDACHLGRGDLARALEAGESSLELGREVITPEFWPMRLLFWAQRLYEAGELEHARLASLDAREAARREYRDDPPYGGEPHFAVLHAEICAALGDHQEAALARREAVAIHRHWRADSPWIHPREHCEALLALARSLDELGRPEAQEVRLEAARLWEEHLLDSPTPYPSELITTLTQLGEHAARRDMHKLAVGAFARAIELAAPHPAHESESIRALEARLDQLLANTGVGLREGLAHYRERIAAPDGSRGAV